MAKSKTKPQTQKTVQTPKEKFFELEAQKGCYIERAEIASELTNVNIFPKEDYTNSNLPTPNQSVGSDGVNTLASKLTLSMLNNNSTKFVINESRLLKNNKQINFAKTFVSSANIPDQQKQALLEQIEEQEKTLSDVKLATARISKHYNFLLSRYGIKNKIGFAMQHFLITGNFALFIDRKYKSRLYSLRDFVVVRDRSGNMIKTVCRDTVAKESLPEDVIEQLGEEFDDKSEVTIYTQVEKISGKDKYKISEYAEDIMLGDSWEQNNSPVIVPFTDYETGTIYNYGLVNLILGDLNSLENLSQNLNDLSQAASKVIFLVDPTSTTDVEVLNNTPNLGFAPGVADDIHTLTLDKQKDLNITYNQAGILEKRIQRFFLMNRSIQKESGMSDDEIRSLQGDIDTALGNMYSILAEEIQLPLAKLMLEYMKMNKELEGLIDDDLEVNIITGIDAMGMDTTKNDFLQLVTAIKQLGFESWLEEGETLYRMMEKFNEEPTGMIKTKKTKAAEDQTAQQAAMQQQVAPELVRGAMNNQQEQGQQ